MSEAAASAYAQLLSVGLVWISFHCAGMCGPILIGFDVAGAARGHTIPRGALAILQYQGGRAVTYTALGALAGLAGVGLDAVFGPAGAVFALLFGATILVTAFWPRRARRAAKTTLERRFAEPSWTERVSFGSDGARLRGHRRPFRVRNRIVSSGAAPRAPQRGPRLPPADYVDLRDQLRPPGPDLPFRLTQALPRLLHPLAISQGPGRPFLLGAVMGLLPCMITFWALGLAATTGSPLHGAGVMVLLVAMTTPMLLGVTLLPRLFRRLNAARVQRVLLAVSGVWLTLVGLAGCDVISHVHIPVALFGDHFVVMLW